jgi:predicted DNA-binding transcriptional regulator YafY
MTADVPLTRSLLRFSALIAALRDGPLRRPELLERLRDTYPQTGSGRRMLDRDVDHLRALAVIIDRDSSTRPPLYTLRGGAPVFDEPELRALALIRDTFGNRHPQAAQVRALLDRLSAQLTSAELRIYARRQSRNAPVQPAIDYTHCAALIERLEHAISRRQIVSFAYRLAAVLAQGEISQRFEAQRVVERLTNGDVIVEAEGRSDFFIVRTLLKYAENAELLHPAWLREKMAEEVRKLAALYDQPG